MTIDESKIPKDGERVRFRHKGCTLWESGVVDFTWVALDALAVRIRTDDGGCVTLYPEFGDVVQADPASGAAAVGE